MRSPFKFIRSPDVAFPPGRSPPSSSADSLEFSSPPFPFPPRESDADSSARWSDFSYPLSIDKIFPPAASSMTNSSSFSGSFSLSFNNPAATDYQGSFGTSLLSLRRDQFHSVDSTVGNEPTRMEVELDSFQRKVAEKFIDLSAVGGDELLSLAWVGELLDAFLCCQEEFRAVIFKHRSQLQRPPMDRLIADCFDRSVKALDVCNAIHDGIEQIRQWQKLIEIVIRALVGGGGEGGGNRRLLGEGQLRRAKKALIDLAIGMVDEKDSSGLAHRNQSFGRNKDQHHHRSIGYFTSLSWSVSRSWSAAKQLKAIGNNIATPRASDIMATNGLAITVYTMTSVLLFVMWALVAAIPCQDRGLHVHFFVHRQFQWAAPIMSLHDRILEESKKKGRENACGLLREINQIERSSRLVSELADSVQFPLTEEKEMEVKQSVQELVQVYEALREGVDPLERQVREVFHRIVLSRTEGLDSLGRAHNQE